MSIRSTRVLERIIAPEQGTFSPEHARYVLSLDFSPEQRAQYVLLSQKAQEGTLTPQEEQDLDEMLDANALLMILQSKARVSLSRHNPAA